MADPRIPGNVTSSTDAGGVGKQNAKLNREQSKRSAKIKRAHESAASKVRSHG